MANSTWLALESLPHVNPQARIAIRYIEGCRGQRSIDRARIHVAYMTDVLSVL
jgi:hypothetical protein